MVNFFSEFNNVSLTFSDIIKTEYLHEHIDILLDRVRNNSVDYILTQLPGLKVIESKGFTDEEIKFWMDYTTRNSALIQEIAMERQADWKDAEID